MVTSFFFFFYHSLTNFRKVQEQACLVVCNCWVHFLFQHTNDFALYTEAIKFFNHPESMVRIAVRTITLNVYKGQFPHALGSRCWAMCWLSCQSTVPESLERLPSMSPGCLSRSRSAGTSLFLMEIFVLLRILHVLVLPPAAAAQDIREVWVGFGVAMKWVDEAKLS